MYKNNIILTLVMGALMLTVAHSQEKLDSQQMKTIKGTVIGLDAVGNIISIQTQDQQKMAFSVPDKAIITQETRNIGLMDIGEASAVTIQYYVLSSSKNIVVSLIDNEPVVNEQ